MLFSPIQPTEFLQFIKLLILNMFAKHLGVAKSIVLTTH